MIPSHTKSLLFLAINQSDNNGCVSSLYPYTTSFLRFRLWVTFSISFPNLIELRGASVLYAVHIRIIGLALSEVGGI